MHQTSPAVIEAIGETVNINCSAYGNTQEMTGSITRSGETISSITERKEGKLLSVKAEVTEEGTYVCSIENKKEKVESATLIKHFTRK